MYSIVQDTGIQLRVSNIVLGGTLQCLIALIFQGGNQFDLQNKTTPVRVTRKMLKIEEENWLIVYSGTDADIF